MSPSQSGFTPQICTHKMSAFRKSSSARTLFFTTAGNNARTFQELSRTSSALMCCQQPWIYKTEFKHFQGFLKHNMNTEWRLVQFFACADALPDANQQKHL